MPEALKVRCWQDGFEQATTQATKTDKSTDDAENDPARQAEAKIGEVVFALTYGLDFEHCFDEATRRRDHDFDTPRGRLDLKSTKLTSHCLIWPRGKNAVFWKKKFDLLGLCKVDVDEGCGYFAGWIEKHRFAKIRQVADEHHPFLKPETRYIEQDALEPPDAIMQEVGNRCACREWAHYGIKRKGEDVYDWYCRDHVELADENFFAYARGH